MITLHTFGPMLGMPDPSPFCMKAMALLKLSGLDFVVEPGADPRKAPKGKIPWAEDDGIIVPDSTFLRLHLEKKHGIDFYPGMSAVDKAVAWAFEKMCEEHLYFCAVHERWTVDANFNKGPRKFFDTVPAVVRPLIIGMVRKNIKRDLKGQGIGRHTRSEINELMRHDMQALADFLGDKTYFLGDTVTGADAVVHSFVSAALTPLFDGPLHDAARGHANLVAYASRLDARWYADPSA